MSILRSVLFIALFPSMSPLIPLPDGDGEAEGEGEGDGAAALPFEITILST